jgi:hypothetical protein
MGCCSPGPSGRTAVTLRKMRRTMEVTPAIGAGRGSISDETTCKRRHSQA